MSRPLAEVLTPLTDMQRIYVQCLLKGMSKRAAATAAGASDPGKYLVEADRSEAVQEALVEARKSFAEEVEFSRREAHEMLLQAFRNADTAGEQVAAVRELIKLHGIAAPEKVEHTHKHEGTVTVEHMTDQQLLELAAFDEGFLIEDAEYEDVTDDDELQRALPAPM